MSYGVNDMDKENFRSLRGALFFGVPCQGMNIESLVPMFPEKARQSLLYSLDNTNSPTLQMLSELYSRRMNSRKDFQCLNFYETMTSPTAVQVKLTIPWKCFISQSIDDTQENGIWKMNGKPVVLVTPASATGGKVYDVESHEALQINRTHSDLVKFSTRFDGAYERVVDFLDSLVKQDPHKV